MLRNAQGKVIGGAETFRDLSEVEALRSELEGRFHIGDFVSRSPQMQKLFEVLPAIAASSSTVLIQGDTGTGKELMARTIHALSPRAKSPFIAVNCAALPDTLLESELFGYKSGAFTGAKKDKPGRFALAKGGTLFLDEIGDISPMLQVRLLRVLQEHTFEPLGSTRSELTDARIIAATNRDLTELTNKDLFRDDLYYRLNVMRLNLPPLHQRKMDIPLLMDHFISRFNRLQQKSITGVSVETLSLLMAYDWPGNIRELENVIERCFILCNEGEINLKHLPPDLTARSASIVSHVEIKTAQNMLEIHTIQQALERNAFNRLAAARELGIHKSTLFRKIKDLNLSLPEIDGRSKRRQS